ncbi:hypothetical protein [Pseudophaeobacter sp.]|uniref:hypothetical protein n=1 Tax=Pseudophaeobacter sp. TaxID=1971739 RepID=UPI004059972A
MSWATDHDASIEKLEQVQGSLTVGLIMVRRVDFLTCSPFDTAEQVKSSNNDYFSFIPVQDEGGRILGLYDAQRWFTKTPPDTLVGEDYIPLSEDIVIGADGSIFDFIRQADANQTNLVIAGNRVAGLVSLSDLQQLPVRAALFALLTSLEMAMTLCIRKNWGGDPNGWMQLLDAGAQKKVRQEISRARRDDVFVDEVLFTTLSHKETVLCKSGVFAPSTEEWKASLKEIRGLRNYLAHAKPFADTPEKAADICAVVRKVFEAKSILLSNCHNRETPD